MLTRMMNTRFIALALAISPLAACKPRITKAPTDGQNDVVEAIGTNDGSEFTGGSWVPEPDVPPPADGGPTLDLAAIVNPFKAYYTKYLGDGYGTPARKTRVHGITYYDNGFSPQNPSEQAAMLTKIAQSVAELKAKKVNPATIAAFEDYAKKFAMNPHEIGDQIDYAFDTIKHRWSACGGKYATAASGIKKSSLVITTQPAPFYLCNTNAPTGCTYAGGVVFSNLRDVMAMIIYVQRVTTDPANAALLRMDAFLRWELGNYFGRAGLGFVPKDLPSEIGEKSPCGGKLTYPPVTPPPPPPPPPVDKTPPQVKITAPLPYVAVKGTVNFTASASDNVAVKEVRLLVNGVLVKTLTAPPYTYQWNTTAYKKSQKVTLTATAVDTAGLTTSHTSYVFGINP